MGFPFETASWSAASEAIFMGAGSSWTLVYSLIAIGLCVAALAVGQAKEAKKYSDYK